MCSPDRWQKVLRPAIHGNANAQTRVGFAYERGIVVKQDSSEAAIWFSLAASRNAIAEYNLGVIALEPDREKREIKIPMALQRALGTKLTKKLDALSFTNKKEFIVWYSG